MSGKVYRNVTLHLEPAVYEQIRKLAFKERTSIVSLTGEAICTYIKWLRLAEIKEAKEAELAEIEANLSEAVDALEEIKKERRVKRRKRRKSGPRKRKAFPGERVYKKRGLTMSNSMSGQVDGNSNLAHEA